jgi:hypothetical protein
LGLSRTELEVKTDVRNQYRTLPQVV